MSSSATRKQEKVDLRHDLITVFMFSMKVWFFLSLTYLVNVAIIEIVCTVIDKVASCK